MSYDSWLTYTANWRTSGTNNDSYCKAEKEKFDEAWTNDTWVTFIDGTKGGQRIGGFHERSTHRSGLTRATSNDNQLQLAVHESLHHRYPRWSETQVRRRIKRLMDYLCIPPGQVITFGTTS